MRKHCGALAAALEVAKAFTIILSDFVAPAGRADGEGPYGGCRRSVALGQDARPSRRAPHQTHA
eukprot:9095657-Alexandrium_andersonii.AAC.1